ALSVEMRGAVVDELARLEADPDVRVLVITGGGDRAFMSGADISEFGARRTESDARADYDAGMAAITRAWTSFSKPIIAAIRGYCMGGGVLTALQADFRYASADAVFAVPAARLGLGYAMGGVRALLDVVGPAWTAEILFSARRLGAEEALQAGLVNRVVDGSELQGEVLSLARTIAGNAPLTVAACKAALRELRKPETMRDTELVAQMVEACFRSEDYREGQAAFAEKRTPRFTGH
ncbi:MAG: enoyl-CoA hydratase, partial [Acidimicrobiales bacterium]